MSSVGYRTHFQLERDPSFVVVVYVFVYSADELIGRSKALAIVRFYFQSAKEPFHYAVIQAITLARHKERDIQIIAAKIIILLTSIVCKDYVLKQLSKFFDITTTEINIAIVSRISNIEHSSSLVNYLKQKASIDNNYLVRELTKSMVDYYFFN